MPRTFRFPPVLIAACLCNLLLLGCMGDDEGNADAGRCAVSQGQALYYGSTEPEQLDLSVAERSAIGTVAPDPPVAVCTGEVIERGWVLTAAHCNLGDTLTFQPSFEGAEAITTLSTTLHPELDLMLLELDRSAAAQALAPVPLWTSTIDEDWVGRQVTLAGVGQTETGGFGTLRFVDEPVVAVDESGVTVDGMGNSGACAGDSGGPILVAAQDGSPRVAGVLDRGSRDCLGIDIYTRADRIEAWVAEVTGMGDGCE